MNIQELINLGFYKENHYLLYKLDEDLTLQIFEDNVYLIQKEHIYLFRFDLEKVKKLINIFD